MPSTLLHARFHPLWLSLRKRRQFKEEKQGTSKWFQGEILHIFNQYSSEFALSSLLANHPHGGTKTGRPISFPLARLTCGQQREPLLQTSNAQGDPGLSALPALAALAMWLPSCCCCCYTAGEQAHRDLLVTTAVPLTPVLLGSFLRSLAPEQNVFCACSAQGLVTNGKDKGQSHFKSTRTNGHTATRQEGTQILTHPASCLLTSKASFSVWIFLPVSNLRMKHKS